MFLSPINKIFPFIPARKGPPGSGGGGGVTDHQALSNLQGGIAGEYYHFSAAEHAALLDLLYKNLVVTFSSTPTALQEKGVSVTPTLNWNIIPNSDVIVSRNINQGVGTLVANGGSVSGGARVDTVTFTLTVNFTRKTIPMSETTNTTVNFSAPQWRGASTTVDYDGVPYATLNSELTKVVQTSNTIVSTVAPTAQYVWFISRNSSATILDGALSASIGNWLDPSTEFWKKNITVTLADGVTTHNYTIYRTRELKTRPASTYTLQ
jgi:hypothetical protein